MSPHMGQVVRRGRGAGSMLVVGAVVGLLVLAVAVRPPAASAGAADEADNAAWWYARSSEEVANLDPEDWQLVQRYLVAPSTEPDARLSPIVHSLRRARRWAVEGANRVFSDPGTRIVWEEPVRLHPNRMPRDVSALLSLEALTAAREGDGAGAGEALSSVYRLTSQLVESDGFRIGWVAEKIVRRMDRTLGYLLDSGQLDAAGARSVLASLEAFEGEVPVPSAAHFAERMAAEAEHLARLHAEARYDEVRRYMGGGYSVDPAEAAKVDLESIAPEAMDAACARASEAARALAEAATLPDPDEAKARIAEIVGAIDDPLVHALFPFLERQARATTHMLHFQRDMVEAQRAALRKIIEAEGEVRPRNAAFVYLDAIALWESSPREMREAMLTDGSRAADDVNPDPTLDGADERSATTIDGRAAADAEAAKALFRKASSIETCDFTFVRRRERVGSIRFVPPYLAGMHDGIRLLLGDATRAMESGDVAAAGRDLTAALRVVRHLAEDPHQLARRRRTRASAPSRRSWWRSCRTTNRRPSGGPTLERP